MSARAVRVAVRGTVQGVWFRGWTAETATRLGLDGWVRNRRDGSVEAHFQGDAAAVERMIAACHRGPSAARVSAVEIHDVATETITGFAQRATD